MFKQLGKALGSIVSGIAKSPDGTWRGPAAMARSIRSQAQITGGQAELLEGDLEGAETSLLSGLEGLDRRERLASHGRVLLLEVQLKLGRGTVSELIHAICEDPREVHTLVVELPDRLVAAHEEPFEAFFDSWMQTPEFSSLPTSDQLLVQTLHLAWFLSGDAAAIRLDQLMSTHPIEQWPAVAQARAARMLGPAFGLDKTLKTFENWFENATADERPFIDMCLINTLNEMEAWAELAPVAERRSQWRTAFSAFYEREDFPSALRMAQASGENQWAYRARAMALLKLGQLDEALVMIRGARTCARSFAEEPWNATGTVMVMAEFFLTNIDATPALTWQISMVEARVLHGLERNEEAVQMARQSLEEVDAAAERGEHAERSWCEDVLVEVSPQLS